MTITPTPPDYYAVLGLDRDASDEDVNRAWRRLVLVHHPDKHVALPVDSSAVASSSRASTHGRSLDIRLINEARAVLSDPTLKDEWHRAFKAGQVGQGAGAGAEGTHARGPSGPHVYRHVSLDEFEAHYDDEAEERTYPGGPDDGPPEAGAGAGAGIDPLWWSYPCRCSGQFVITLPQLEDGVEVVGCEGCGEWLRVGYEVVDDDGDGDGEGGGEGGAGAGREGREKQGVRTGLKMGEN